MAAPGTSPGMTIKHLFLAAPLLGACLTEDPYSETTQDIHGDTASPATQFELDRAVKIPGCTATRISARFALTSAHCNPSVGSTVRFYTTGPGVSTDNARIEQVIFRPGVTGPACNNDIDDCWDTAGQFADIALLRLSAAVEDDLEGAQATLAWTYPGDGHGGYKVGAGQHDGNPNPDAILLQAYDETSRDNDDDGRFYTVDDMADPGDSGGPFYYSNRVLGTLWGKWWEPFDHYNIYTSVPEHLSWILGQIGYSWRGQPAQSNTIYSGTAIQTFFASELRCQYACEKTASCEAYNFDTSVGVCSLQDNIQSVGTASGYHGALKFGERQGTSNDVVGYVRSDGINAVVHRATNGRIHELWLAGGTWNAGDIQGTGPAVASKLTAYRRADGTNAVVYRSTLNHIIELALVSGQWQAFDLTASAGGESAGGNPVAYVRADGVSAVVYRGASTGHIIELRLGSRGWLASDLTAAAGSAIVASSDPSAFVRSDGYNSVVFRAGTQIIELYEANGQAWSIGGPSSLAGAPDASSRPFGVTNVHGQNQIVYRTTANLVVLLFLSGGQWSFTTIGSAAVGDPVAYVRTDTVESVLFRNSFGSIMELTNPTAWQLWNLTSVTGAAASVTSPAVYHRKDGYNAVLFETVANHAGELYFKRGGTWSDGDITAVAGETP